MISRDMPASMKGLSDEQRFDEQQQRHWIYRASHYRFYHAQADRIHRVVLVVGAVSPVDNASVHPADIRRGYCGRHS